MNRQAQVLENIEILETLSPEEKEELKQLVQEKGVEDEGINQKLRAVFQKEMKHLRKRIAENKMKIAQNEKERVGVMLAGMKEAKKNYEKKRNKIMADFHKEMRDINQEIDHMKADAKLQALK